MIFTHVPLLAPMLFAFANRFRGGWLPTHHTTLTRAIFALVWAVVFAPVVQFWAFGAFAAVFAGSVVGHARFMGLARWWQYPLLALTGLANLCGVAAILWWLAFPQWWILLLAGAAKPIAYQAGKICPTLGKNFAQGPELGELFFGFVSGLGAALALRAF